MLVTLIIVILVIAIVAHMANMVLPSSIAGLVVLALLLWLLLGGRA